MALLSLHLGCPVDCSYLKRVQPRRMYYYYYYYYYLFLLLDWRDGVVNARGRLIGFSEFRIGPLKVLVSLFLEKTVL